MSLYTPVFPPSLECRSTGNNGVSSSNQPSSGEILRDIHLFLATKPEVLAPSSRPSSPSFDTNVQKLKRSVLDAIDATRGDTGSGKWKKVSEKLRMGCVRGRYRMTGRKQGWHPPEDVEWILPDDEETWFKLQTERTEMMTMRLKGKIKRSSHPDDVPATSAHVPDTADNTSPAEIVDLRKTVSSKTMRNVTKKVTKWRATISTEGTAPVQKSASRPDLEGKIVTKNKYQSSSLGFPVVKRNISTVAGKKGEGRFERTPLPNLPSHGIREHDHAPIGSKALAGQGRQVPCDGEPEKASIKSPLRSVVPDGDLPKITDFLETPYIPPSFPSQLETSTPPRRDPAVPVRKKPSPIYPVSPSSSIPRPRTPRSGDQQDPGEDPHIVDLHSSLRLHFDDLQSKKRPPPPYYAASSTLKKRRATLSPEENSTSRSQIIAEVETPKHTVMPTSPHSEDKLPTLTELLAASPCPKVRPRPLLEDILLVDNRSEPSSRPDPIRENTSPTKSYFSTPGGSEPSNSPTSARNLLLHSPLSPMLSFAQDPNAFLPQFTSTQAGDPHYKGTSNGNFGAGYSSQFDVERHVDRVSELLEKDVDFDGWLRDVEVAEEREDTHV